MSYLIANNLSDEQTQKKTAGVHSAKLADTEIGLSFQMHMPLDMRIDKRIETTATDIKNKSVEKSLADLIYKFGQERDSRRIASFIVREREDRPISTTR